MDHLLEAKKQVTGDKYLSKNNILLSIALSAIAIAEELEKIHKPSEQKYYDGLSDGNEIERLR